MYSVHSHIDLRAALKNEIHYEVGVIAEEEVYRTVVRLFRTFCTVLSFTSRTRRGHSRGKTYYSDE